MNDWLEVLTDCRFTHGFPVATTAMVGLRMKRKLLTTASALEVVGDDVVPVSAHDVVGGHVLVIGAAGVLIDQDGEPIRYGNEERMREASLRCFGGAPKHAMFLQNETGEVYFQPNRLTEIDQ